MIPIFKKGDRSSPANYRPIFLTSVLCKTLEHILSSNIIVFVEVATLKWIENFQDRCQQVLVNVECCQLSKVTSGVPQGSVLLY